jgi:carbon storage regulator
LSDKNSLKSPYNSDSKD